MDNVTKLTRADLENQGITVEDMPEDEIPPKITGGTAPLEDLKQYYLGDEYRPPVTKKPKSRAKQEDKETKILLQVMSLAIKILAIRVLLFAAGGVSAFLFYMAMQDPKPAKIVSAVAFTVLVFLPTLYYSKRN